MENLVHAVLRQPRPPGAPRRVWRDWVLAGAMVVSTVIEVGVRTDTISAPYLIGVMAVLVGSTFWRRTDPLLTAAAAFGAATVLNIVSVAADYSPGDLVSPTWILILGYSLARWGSGREVAAGAGVMFVTLVVGAATNSPGIGNAIGGGIVLFFPAVVGVAVRLQRLTRLQQAESIRLQEREQIARELHDTVAHHVSAIAIQAQAGRFLASSNSLEGATNALEVIEEEASRTLVEMRAMIGILRQSADADLAPHMGIAQLERLASSGSGTALPVHVDLSGDLESIADPVSTTIFRLAQESITNATRHARNATRVDVHINAGSDVVELTVSDDGSTTSGAGRTGGFGLVGMSERVDLLGGSFVAGPVPERGWTVRATLPRSPTYVEPTAQ